MAYSNEYEKMQAQEAYPSGHLSAASTPAQPYYGDTCTNQTYRPSPVDEAEKSYINHSEQAMKAQMAVSFLRANPAFDEFIKLIRSGAIQI